MQYREFLTITSANDTEFVLKATLGSITDQQVVTRGVSEETDFKTAAWTQLQLMLANAPAASTALACSVLTRGLLSKFFSGASFSSRATTLVVPVGNPGDIQFRIDPGGYSLTYTQNGGSPTALVDTDVVTFADGDRVYLTISSVGAQEIFSGYLIDVETGQQIDSFQLMNTSP